MTPRGTKSCANTTRWFLLGWLMVVVTPSIAGAQTVEDADTVRVSLRSPNPRAVLEAETDEGVVALCVSPCSAEVPRNGARVGGTNIHELVLELPETGDSFVVDAHPVSSVARKVNLTLFVTGLVLALGTGFGLIGATIESDGNLDQSAVTAGAATFTIGTVLMLAGLLVLWIGNGHYRVTPAEASARQMRRELVF